MLHRAAPLEQVLPASFSRARLTLVSVDFTWAGGTQVLAICFVGWSEVGLEEVHMQEMHSDGLLIKYIPVDVNKAGNHLPPPNCPTTRCPYKRIRLASTNDQHPAAKGIIQR